MKVPKYTLVLQKQFSKRKECFVPSHPLHDFQAQKYEILSRKTKVQRCLFNESLPHIPNYILSTLITTRKQEFIIELVILIIRDGSILINLESKIHMLK